jgi:hypothetical protein
LVCGNGKNGQLGLTDSSGLPIVEVDHPQEGTKKSVSEINSCGCEGSKHDSYRFSNLTLYRAVVQ